MRGVVYDPRSVLPSLDRVIETVRQELERSSSLGILFIRPEYWGRASELFSWRELEQVYRTLSQVVLDLMGDELRRLDLPSDLGLYGEGLAIVLSAPREQRVIDLSDVEIVAERTAEALREHLAGVLPARLAERLSVEVGSGVVCRPDDDQTLEDALVMGLVAAEESARATQQRRVRELGDRLLHALERGSLGVLFQPVVDMRRDAIAGFDAVLQGPHFHNLALGDVVFDVARRTGHSYRAFDAYHETALRLVEERLQGSEFVILRVAASELLERAVRAISLLYRRQGKLAPSNVVFLVGIDETLEHLPSSVVAMRSVSDMGFQLALDIPADGSLPLDHLRELAPDFLRIGGRTLRHLHEQQDEFELVLMLSRFAARHQMRVLAVDCEERGEVVGLRRAAVDLIQGDFFAPYAAVPVRPGMEAS